MEIPNATPALKRSIGVTIRRLLSNRIEHKKETTSFIVLILTIYFHPHFYALLVDSILYKTNILNRHSLF